jgi:CO dehydrogenase maturation factor
MKNMGTIIAITGKGGTGKTTFAGLIIRALLDNKKGSVLGIDADPNSNLAEALGLKIEDTISSICEETLRDKENLPAGMSKDRYLEYRIQQSLVEKNSLSLLSMGRPEGPGCYCYVNNLLRDMIKDLTDGYNFSVIDNEAGMEHLSRKTMRKIDLLYVVSDFSVAGVRSAARIYKLACDMGIKLGKGLLIINKVKGEIGALAKEIQESGLTLEGTLPFDTEVENISLNGRSLFDLASETGIVKEIRRITAQTLS